MFYESILRNKITYTYYEYIYAFIYISAPLLLNFHNITNLNEGNVPHSLSYNVKVLQMSILNWWILIKFLLHGNNVLLFYVNLKSKCNSNLFWL